MSGRLSGKLCVVTGASRGIGAATARAYAAEGARVVICSRRQPGLDAVAEQINADFPESVFPRALHVGHLDDVGPWFQAIQDELGVPDVLVNNAGTNPYFGPMLGTEWPAWDKTFEVNLKGPFEMTRQFVKRLYTVPKPGSVINTSSVLGQTSSRMQGVYGMTKAAMISMTKTLAIELGGTRVRVNAVAPGVIDTRLAAALTTNDSIKKMITERTALGRVGVPDELAGVMVFLASDESSYVTGQTFNVDGGYTIF